MPNLTLYSSRTCPFVQQVLIALAEKQLSAEIVAVDTSSKPDWFKKLSPLGMVPVLKVEREGKPDTILFESAAILDFIEEAAAGTRLLPSDPLERARLRSWREFGAHFIADLQRLTTAQTPPGLAAARTALSDKLKRLESNLLEGPYFAGMHFSLVDVAFAPPLRQLEAIESANRAGLLDGLPKLEAWRRALANRPSVAGAVPHELVEQDLERMRREHALVLREAA